jgi:hypothetical protein
MRKLRRAQQRRVEKNSRFKQKAFAAGTAAVITFGIGLTINKAFAGHKPDNHQLSVSRDADADLLADREEFAIGYQQFTADQNRNEIPDGAELARRCAAVVNGLPFYIPGTMMPIPFGPYKIQHALFGIERCDVCGKEINMGGWEIINTRINMQFPDPNDPLDGMFLPDLALHYMEHGSFDCYGEIHRGRVDIARLLRVLELRFPYEPDKHQLSLESSDLDSDFLADSEELAAGYNLYNVDQDENLVPDGVELARQCSEVIDALPILDPNGPEANAIHKIDFMQRGLEWCEVCGESINMGYRRIVNLRLGLSIEVPYIVSHYMQHGSFSYSGDVHGQGRIDVPLLVKILEMPSRCGDLGTVYLPADLNKDCKVDIDDFVEFVDRWIGEQTPTEVGD